MVSEKDIIVRLKEGDEKAIAIIFNLYHKNLYYFAKQIINSKEQIEDLIADAFIKLWQKHNDFNELSAVKSFLYMVVRNSCLNYLRHLHRKEQTCKQLLELAEKDEDYIESKIIKAELLQAVLQEIDKLPVARQKIFKMIFLDDLSIFEIAEQLQITTDTVRVQKARALHSIRSVMLKKLWVVA